MQHNKSADDEIELSELLYNKDKTILLECPKKVSGVVKIPHSVIEIGESAFRKCDLITEIHLPDSMTVINNQAFNECCNLIKINIPESVTKIGYCAFEECSSLTDISIPDSIKEIEFSTFQDCRSLVSVKIPDTVTAIGHMAFCSCKSLKSVVLPNGIAKIEYRTFAFCESLEDINIPDSVIELETGAFARCDKLPRAIKIKIGKMRRKQYEKYSVSVKGKNDVLSFEKLNIQPGLYGGGYIYSKTALFAKTIINGRPYLDIIKPYLKEAADMYIFRHYGFIYKFADTMYKELTANKKGKRDIRLIDITYVYDARQPLCVIAKETTSEITWSAYCHYNDFWHYGELPVFRFDKTQYSVALEELKVIVDEQNKLPAEKSLGEGVYNGRLRKGKPVGCGTLTWADGSKHEGTWKNGKRQGKFVYTEENGFTRHETWDNNLLVKYKAGEI